MKTLRDELDGYLGLLLLLAVGCAGVLVLGVASPGDVARTSWTQMGGEGGTRIVDSPAGYVGLVSLCGLVALAALLVAACWPRARLAAVVLAAGAFAAGAAVAVRYQVLLSHGVMGLEGRPDTTGWSAGYTVEPPAALPFFVLVAVVGALLAALYAVVWWPRRGEREHF